MIKYICIIQEDHGGCNIPFLMSLQSYHRQQTDFIPESHIGAGNFETVWRIANAPEIRPSELVTAIESETKDKSYAINI